MLSAREIIETMYRQDAFSQWLGIEIVAVGEGSCTLKMTVRSDMTNGFGIAHGGITFSLADSALAFASNAHGQKAVSIHTSINHLQPVRTGDELSAVATETHLGNRIAHYTVAVRSGEHLVAEFKGTVYRKSERWKEANPAE